MNDVIFVQNFVNKCTILFILRWSTLVTQLILTELSDTFQFRQFIHDYVARSNCIVFIVIKMLIIIKENDCPNFSERLKISEKVKRPNSSFKKPKCLCATKITE